MGDEEPDGLTEASEVHAVDAGNGKFTPLQPENAIAECHEMVRPKDQF